MTATVAKAGKWRAGADYAGRQSQGARPNQEDAYGVVPPENLPENLGDEGALLAIVADGMGGHAAGEVASELAVRAFVDGFFDAPAPDAPTRLWAGLEAANHRIRQAIRDEPQLKGMGTTLTALLVHEGMARWISVGDSPLYLIRESVVRRLNHLHLAAEAPDGDLAAPGRRGALASAVIGERLYEVDDAAPVPLAPGDLLVTASDGLNTLTEAELARVLAASPSATAAGHADALLQAVAAQDLPRQDNTTVVVIHWH